MRPRAPSLHEALFPDDLPEFENIANAWPDDVINEMLSLVWDGFEQMKAQHFQGCNFSKPIEQLERGLTDLHMDEITLLWKNCSDGFGAFIPKHEAWEFRNRKNASSMPASIDIGFVHRTNRSQRWSVEAKVLEHPADVSRYLGDLTGKYLTGKSAIHTHTGALAGYLRRGLAEDVILHLEKCLSQTLKRSSAFPSRPHRTSEHSRTPEGTTKATPFTCHHLILKLN